MVDVAVYGARGYLGRTLVGLLTEHPSTHTVHPVSSTAAGRSYGDEVPSLGHLGHLDIVAPDDDGLTSVDVAFLATSSKAAKTALAGPDPGIEAADAVIDLSRAKRATALAGDETWSYAIAEAPGALDPDTSYIANPGCYPTASLLALAPALVTGLAGSGPLVVDGKSGVSGAGATPRDDLHFPETNESLRAYSVAEHDHTAEIQAATAILEGHGPNQARPVRFTPHLVPQNRGLLATCYLPLADHVTSEDVHRAYAKAYPDESFVDIVDEPDTANVRGSNRAQVAATVDQDAGLLVARGAIDNLVKGGAGTAVQNMNQVLGLDPTAGLPQAGVAP